MEAHLSTPDFAAYSDEALLWEIGNLHQKYSGQNQTINDDQEPDIPIGMSPRDHLRALGANVTKRIGIEFFTLICGSGTHDANERKNVLSILGAPEAITAASITGALSAINIPPALAAALAVILLRRVFVPAGNEICKYFHNLIDGIA